MQKNDPYAALRFKEFNIFLLMRFLLVFGWSMQFIVIEWQVYALTKSKLALGIIGLMEFLPAFFMALFAGHIVDQKEKRNLLALCINAATWSSSMWQIARVLGVGFAGFSIAWIGVHWSLCIIFSLVMLSLAIVFQIKRKPILNPKIGEPMLQSLKEGLSFVFKTKAILGALTLDMISVLFGGAVILLTVFAEDILKVGPQGFGILVAAPSVGSFLTMLITAYIPISRHEIISGYFWFWSLYYNLWTIYNILGFCVGFIF